MSTCYVDTSALAKRYVNEARSEEVDDFLAAQSLLLMTSLTRTEMRSLLARRRRAHDFDAAAELGIATTFFGAG